MRAACLVLGALLPLQASAVVIMWAPLGGRAVFSTRTCAPRALEPIPDERTSCEQPKGFTAGFRTSIARVRTNYLEERERAAQLLQSKWARDRIAHASVGQRAVGSLIASFLVSEICLFGGSAAGAWALGMGDPTSVPEHIIAIFGVRLGSAMSSGMALRFASRPLRLAIELVLTHLIFRRSRESSAPLMLMREHVVRSTAVVACVIVTLRALDRGPLATLELCPLEALSSDLHASALAAVHHTRDVSMAMLARAQTIAPFPYLVSFYCAIAATEDAAGRVAAAFYNRALLPLIRFAYDLYLDSWLRIVLLNIRGVLFQTLLG